MTKEHKSPLIRPYFEYGINELVRLVHENREHKQVLGEIRDELTFRKGRQAKALLKDVRGLLEGALPEKKSPPRPPSADDQGDLNL